MIDPPGDRRPPLTPQLALRVAVAGSVALALFAVIFFRLWFLQVLSGTQYVNAAKVNRVRDIAINAPRGDILDRNGAVLVDSTKELAVQIVPAELPVPVNTDDVLKVPRRDAIVYNRLAGVVGMPTRRTRCPVPMPPPSCTTTQCPKSTVTRLSAIGCQVAQQVARLPYADVTVKSPVSRAVQFYLAERQLAFPGVAVQQIYVTGYPQHTLAAQALGTVGPISPGELHARAYRGATRNSIVGQTGLEAEYDAFLRGTPGIQKVQVNADGQPTGSLSTTAPVSGHDLQLSLDAALQRVGQRSLAESISQNDGAGGAFVAMNPTDGEVYGMGSEPSFDPSIFTKPLSDAAYAKLNSAAAGQPVVNRAIQGAGPTGSTFKPITATAALQSGDWTTTDTYDDTGQFCVGTGAAGQCRHNAGHAVDGVLALPDAIRVSSDDFFYNLGAKLNVDPTAHPTGGPLQQWARAFGIGRATGIDLPGGLTGTLPTPRWRQSRNRLEQECDDATGPFKGKPKHPPGGCGIADGTNRPWSIGDNISLAVGQGDVQVSPLQLAVAYAALANGGTIVRPHLGLSVQDQDGTVLQRIDPPPSRHISIDPLYLDTIREGLCEATSQAGGTSYDVMGKFHQQVYGKTGTAQYFSAQDAETDYAWYACFVPATATSKPIVVVVWVEKGGFGDVGAAPVARQILSQWFYGKPGPYVAGSSTSL